MLQYHPRYANLEMVIVKNILRPDWGNLAWAATAGLGSIWPYASRLFAIYLFIGN